MDILGNKTPTICKRITRGTSVGDYFLIYEAESPTSTEKRCLLLKHIYFQDFTDTLRTSGREHVREVSERKVAS